MSRQEYAVKTIESAAHLLTSCDDVAQIDAIIERMKVMLNKVWAFEHRAILHKAPRMSWNAAFGVFWDGVHTGLVATGKLHAFCAVYGEEINPPGQAGNVHISFQPVGVVSRFVAKLSIPKGDAELCVAFNNEPQKLHVQRLGRPDGGTHRKRTRSRRR